MNRRPSLQTRREVGEEGGQCGAGDRPTVGHILVRQPQGEDEKEARSWDHQSSEVRGRDVEHQGQPAVGFTLVLQPRGEDEEEARAGTVAPPVKS